MGVLKEILAVTLCAVAILLPYRLRGVYLKAIATMIHVPFKAFGRLTTQLMRKLNVTPDEILNDPPKN